MDGLSGPGDDASGGGPERAGKLALWDRFCSGHRVAERGVPLFASALVQAGATTDITSPAAVQAGASAARLFAPGRAEVQSASCPPR